MSPLPRVPNDYLLTRNSVRLFILSSVSSRVISSEICRGLHPPVVLLTSQFSRLTKFSSVSCWQTLQWFPSESPVRWQTGNWNRVTSLILNILTHHNQSRRFLWPVYKERSDSGRISGVMSRTVSLVWGVYVETYPLTNLKPKLLLLVGVDPTILKYLNLLNPTRNSLRVPNLSVPLPTLRPSLFPTLQQGCLGGWTRTDTKSGKGTERETLDCSWD